MSIINVKVVDHSDDVLRELKKQVELGLQGIGVEAATYAQKDCPVDSGRLRNSIAWAISDKSGQGGAPVQGEHEKSSPLAQPEPGTVYIGSNVDYAVYVEYRDNATHQTGKAHFLRDAATAHGDRYKEIMKAALLS